MSNIVHRYKERRYIHKGIYTQTYAYIGIHTHANSQGDSK